ncbi:phosphatase [Effusibacillus lacus]|uniref:Phosphatase n=1 Tax=Effusibacillus lacus TaxID=1348429 RepID=A0A292YM63_9BACL|nr:phosphatase [Effusibacillus lacus]
MAEREISDVEVRSAGVAAYDGSPASPGALEALKQRQIDGDVHRAQMFTEEIGEWADLILTMTTSHKMTVGGRFPQFLDKLFTLKEYVGGYENPDIADPFGGSQDVYEQSAREIEQALHPLVERLSQR